MKLQRRKTENKLEYSYSAGTGQKAKEGGSTEKGWVGYGEKQRDELKKVGYGEK